MNAADQTQSASAVAKELQQQAAALLQAGQSQQAKKCYQQLLQFDPANHNALRFLTKQLLANGQVQLCHDMLQTAVQAAPQAAHPHLHLAMLHRARGQTAAALEALNCAVELGDDGLAALYKGKIECEQQQAQAALHTWSEAWKNHAQLRQWQTDPTTPKSVYRLLQESAAFMLKMRREHILAALDEVDQLHGSDSSQGIRQAIAVALNEQTVKLAHPMQKPGFLNYPGLSPQPFYDTGQFDWVDELQTACAAIRKELLSVLANDDSELHAYVELPNAQNTAQWQTLNQSLQWSSYHLYRDGEPQQQHCLDCPVTTAAIQHLPLVDVQQHAPEVFFSMLRPGTLIPPHFGLSNYKLAVHLPLIIPDHCAIRVGDQTHCWQEGQIVVFDDSFEHEAWNRSEQLRAVLIFEIWHPQLNEGERAAIRTGIEALLGFNQRHGMRLNLKS